MPEDDYDDVAGAVAACPLTASSSSHTLRSWAHARADFSTRSIVVSCLAARRSARSRYGTRNGASRRARTSSQANDSRRVRQFRRTLAIAWCRTAGVSAGLATVCARSGARRLAAALRRRGLGRRRVGHLYLLPTRHGNGALEALADEGLFRAPRLADLERSLTLRASSRDRGRHARFCRPVDLQRFSDCPRTAWMSAATVCTP